ncbi:MAG: lysine transporter LysE [Candidatus Lokiarchaeota archaeon]|nr:lysine transporter LysE [Candidatus Lokiarchaeota archaeon]MBD3339615.1 lysine transporter LysE [Candidatus Lokiarchaeota archaeon]
MIEIFLISFIVALTGALSPGPVLTFTIYKSLQERGYLAGFFIILGHATLEFCLILVLLLGAYIFLQNLIVLTLIGLIGGIFLTIFGFLVIKDALKSPLQINVESIDESEIKGYKGNSFIGGIVISLSNPFWSFWWAVIGLALMIHLGISFDNPLGLLLFFLGHELGDFVFYVPLSIFIYMGGKSLNPKVYKYVLIGCGIFMIAFGIYLALNIILFPPDL